MKQKRSSIRPNSPVNRWKPDLNAMLLDKLTASVLELKGLADDLDPPAHTETREGVCYQLHEAPTFPHEPDIRSRRLMSFKAFCKQYDKRQR